MKWIKLGKEFIKQTGLMFIGISLFNLFNLVYQLFMVRSLPLTDYGHLNALMALFTVVSVPASTVQATVTKFVASFKVLNRYDRVKSLLGHLLLLVSIMASVIFVLIVLIGSHLSSFLQISSHGLFVLLGIALLFALVVPVPWGGLQGLQKFGLLAVNFMINGGLKLALGVLFVLLGYGVSGAVSAIALSYCATTFLSLFMLKMSLPKAGSVAHESQHVEASSSSYVLEVYRYFFPSGLTFLCFMVLTNIDLILVKHFFAPIEAGYYSIAQMAGKIILFLPLPISMVVFPKFASLEGQRKNALVILTQSLTITVLLCTGAVMICFLFPSVVVKILSGDLYPECVPLVKYFSVSMTFFSLTLVLLYYHLSTIERGFLYPLSGLTLIEIVFIALFHNTLTQVLLVVTIAAACSLGILLGLAYGRGR